MMPEEEPFDNNGYGRASSGSEVVIVNGHPPPAEILPRPGRPYCINNMNISTSPGARVGDNYITVTNVNHSEEVVKGRFLGLEVISPAHARRLRCSVAVTLCWALALASGLAIYFFHSALSTKYRIDIDLPCWKFIWAYVKNSTRAERVCCSVAVILVALCVALAVYFSVFYNADPSSPDDEPWYVTRDDWLAEAYGNDDINPKYEPLFLVVIQHTASPECHSFQKCCSGIRNLQSYFIDKKDRDIPYNFLVGNDGRVYEGRGWHKEGAFLLGYNQCSLGIGFIGDYREEMKDYTKVTELQQNRLNMILDIGVKLGYLHPEYKVAGAKDLKEDPHYQSPGSNLHNAMQSWPHYDHTGRFKLKNCSQIITMPFP